MNPPSITSTSNVTLLGFLAGSPNLLSPTSSQGISCPRISRKPLTSLGWSSITSKGRCFASWLNCLSFNFIRISLPQRVMGLEPTTTCLGSKHSTAELHPQKLYLNSNPMMKSCKATLWQAGLKNTDDGCR